MMQTDGPPTRYPGCKHLGRMATLPRLMPLVVCLFLQLSRSCITIQKGKSSGSLKRASLMLMMFSHVWPLPHLWVGVHQCPDPSIRRENRTVATNLAPRDAGGLPSISTQVRRARNKQTGEDSIWEDPMTPSS